MEEKNKDTESVKFESLEDSDTKESLRQLWWTIGVTLLGLALLAYFYL
ncbi:MAG: hypothetical protein GTO41_26650 [Burkholderiales bacterium]|nr:hypothetical protein [Burkholderiales bacterium]